MHAPDRRHPRPQDRVRPGEPPETRSCPQSVDPRPELREVNRLDRRHPRLERVIGERPRHRRRHTVTVNDWMALSPPGSVAVTRIVAVPLPHRRQRHPGARGAGRDHPRGLTTTPCRSRLRRRGPRTPATRPRSACPSGARVRFGQDPEREVLAAIPTDGRSPCAPPHLTDRGVPLFAVDGGVRAASPRPSAS